MSRPSLSDASAEMSMIVLSVSACVSGRAGIFTSASTVGTLSNEFASSSGSKLSRIRFRFVAWLCADLPFISAGTYPMRKRDAGLPPNRAVTPASDAIWDLLATRGATSVVRGSNTKTLPSRVIGASGILLSTTLPLPSLTTTSKGGSTSNPPSRP